jgi:hypothetical protein
MDSKRAKMATVDDAMEAVLDHGTDAEKGSKVVDAEDGASEIHGNNAYGGRGTLWE